MTKAKVPVEIRMLTSADADGWRALWADYLVFYGSSVTEAVYATTFARLIGADDQDFCGLVALHDGKIVGLTHYLFHRHCWRIENVCYLQDLFVSPDMRGMGIARQLIEAVYRAADQAGAPSVYWMTQSGNTTARQLYDRIAAPTDFMKYQRVVS